MSMTTGNGNGSASGGRGENLHTMLNIFCRQQVGLNVCHINAQSLNPKIDEFRGLFVGSEVDIVCVSETWFQEDILDNHYCLKGYNVFRADRNQRIGGGVAVYVRVGIKCKMVIKSPPGSLIDYCLIDVAEVTNEGSCLVGVIYRPNCDIDLSPFYTVLEMFSSSFANVIICGDFNCNILNNERSKSFIDNMRTLSLHPVNTQTPTHFTDSSSTLLDLFFVSDCQDVLFYNQLSAPAFSRHDLIFATFNMTSCSPQTYTYRDYNQVNADLLEQDILGVDWQQIYFMSSPVSQVDFFQTNVLNLFNTHVPLKTKFCKHRTNEWCTRDIIQLMNKRDAEYKRWKRFRLTYIYNNFRNLRNQVVSKIRQAKRAYFSVRFSRNLDPKKLWKNLKDIGVGRNKKQDLGNIDPDQLNIDFVNLQAVVPNTLHLDHVSRDSHTQFEFSNVNQTDVLSAVLKIKSKSVGVDDVHPIFVKALLPHLLPVLTHIFNTVILTSTFPTMWKRAKIIPILKKQGTRYSPPEYRPISILPFLSKVLEKLIHQQLSGYLNRTNFFCTNQSGFRQKHSCITALLKVTDDIREALDNDNVTLLTLLDFSKAFDTVNHSILLQKLKTDCHLSSSALKLVGSYLSERQQSVVVQNKRSKFIKTTAGVPQGSILGPLLFSIFINDLPISVNNSSVHLYADDVQIYISGKIGMIEDTVSRLNDDLKGIFLWSQRNCLQVNPSKSHCLVIYKTKLDLSCFPTVCLGSSVLQYVDKAKNLGICFNRTLGWDDHIQSIIGKIYACLRNLSMSKHYTPLSTKLMLVKSLILPIITYGCQIFIGYNAEFRRKLTIAFNNVVRYVFDLRRYDHISPFVKKVLGCTLHSYLTYRTLMFLHLTMTTKQPTYLSNKLRFSRSARSLILIQPRYTCLISERQFFVSAVRLWNSLPLSVRRLYVSNTFGDVLFGHFAAERS